MKRIADYLNEDIVGFHWKDLLTVLLILILYGILSFYRLGDLDGPNTFYREKMSHDIVFEFDDTYHIQQIRYFSGEDNFEFNVYSSLDGEEYRFLQKVKPYGVFTWNNILLDQDSKYIKFVPLQDSSFGEVAFFDDKNQYLSYSCMNEYLLDEKDLVPEHISYMNSTYFDEVYFARTAFEYVHGMKVYEWTHPPLGKIIQAIPIYLTHSFSPFLYRFMGNIAGILMLAVMYVFGAIFFKKRGYAIFSSLLMGLDTFHFAHTRMGTVDSHLVLFIMISVLFMVLYVKKDKNIYLFLSGLFFGLSVCVKWTGFYAGIGLAILYFYYFIKNKKDIISSIVKGSLFFIVVPLILYCSCYFLFPNNYYYTDSFDRIVDQQKQMYDYHSNLKDEHFFSSKWYTWPVSYKPVWYHLSVINDDLKETISGVGNLVIWIMGIFAFIYSICKMFIRKDKDSFIFILFILSLWLPYVFIGRIMFLYHYFPVLPFLFLCIVSFFKDFTERFKLKFIIPVYLILCLAFFIVYYPIVSGCAVSPSSSYIESIKLFDSWYF